MIQQARDTLPGLKTTENRQAPPLSGLTRFTNQGFLLWDYLINVSNADLEQHFKDLTSLCIRRKIRRAIIFIRDPANSTFFQPTNTGENSFVFQANNLFNQVRAEVTNFEIAVFFESGNFSSNAPAQSKPTVNPLPSTSLSEYFSDLGNMLDWSKAMIGQVPGIKEISFDPEASGATKSIQQLVYNYTDEYKYLNGLDSIRIGTTVGIDESKITYANLATFPVSNIYTNQISTFPENPQPNWSRGSDATSPLLQSIYIQVYETSIPAIFAAGFNSQTGRHNGQLAGQYFNLLLRDQPYLTGQGTITFTQGNPTVTGSGTNFTSFADPFLFANDTVNNIPNRKIGVVESIASNTSLSLEDPFAVFSETNSPFTRTEIVTAWDTQPQLTQEMLNNIYWMLSVNFHSPLNFFGNWQLSDFMDFVSSSVEQNNTASKAPFSDSSTSSPLSFPSNNFVIYNYDFATTIVNTTPTNNGDVDPWNL